MKNYLWDQSMYKIRNGPKNGVYGNNAKTIARFFRRGLKSSLGQGLTDKRAILCTLYSSMASIRDSTTDTSSGVSSSDDSLDLSDSSDDSD